MATKATKTNRAGRIKTRSAKGSDPVAECRDVEREDLIQGFLFGMNKFMRDGREEQLSKALKSRHTTSVLLATIHLMASEVRQLQSRFAQLLTQAERKVCDERTPPNSPRPRAS